ncbi:MAG: glycine zipper 2TM domain-containing protein [Burkholderiales bacterium]|nr:glycine zipper 2TM domain-containing protein [Burkholderiales bacterium]MCE7875871.1 glycine zipper 2TM domain-containing protein [Betaproteobacteria bacterium PRO3]
MLRTLFRSCIAAAVFASPFAAAQVTLYAQDHFRGANYLINWDTPNLDPYGFNDKTRSVIIDRGRWEFCADAHFGGRCTVLTPGQYPSLYAMGLEGSISSLRRVGGNVAGSYPPAPPPNYAYYPRYGEPLYQADVISVRAVVGPPEERCWVEPQQHRGDQVAGAVIGGILGGVLGHQIGGGTGRDVATAIGAVGGAYAGSTVAGRGQGGVQKCQTIPGSGQPTYWDVVYRFRGRNYTAQLSFPPGATITVNGRGEPRV